MTRKAQATLAALAFFAVGTVAAQDFPNRPITIVIPYPAGGTSDGQVRMFQEKLGKLLGQAVVVENKPGASGAIGAQYVARSKPDGHTLMYPNTGFLITPLLSDKSGYDPLKDFKPITQTTSVPMVLMASKTVPANNIAEFIQYARKQPGGILTRRPAQLRSDTLNLLDSFNWPGSRRRPSLTKEKPTPRWL